MSSPTEQPPLTGLSDACTSGRRLLDSLYVYRSIARTLPPLEQAQSPLKLCRSLCLLFEDECSVLQEFETFHWTLLGKITAAVKWLASEVPGGSSIGLSLSVGTRLAEAFWLVHLLDCVKIRKPGLGLDSQLYEEALKRVLDSTDSDNLGAVSDFQHRLKVCTGQAHFLTAPWSVLKPLVNELRNVAHAGRVLSRLVEFLARSLQSEQEGTGVGMLAHQRNVLMGALPIVLYVHCFVSKRGGSDEGIPQRQIEVCAKLLRKNPVVPGIGDIVLELARPLSNVQLGKETGRRVMVLGMADMERKNLLALEQRYSLKHTTREVREVHDNLCEEIVGFMKDANRLRKEGNHQDSPFIEESSNHAFDLLLRLLQHLSLLHSRILSLHAWRVAIQMKNKGSSEGSSVFKDEDLQSVSVLVSCLRGLAGMFNKAWKSLLPFLQLKSQNVCKLFLARFFKKAGNPSDGRIQDLFNILRGMRHDQSIGMSQGTESSRSGSSSISFDPARLECLVQLRQVVEELVAIDEALVLKARFSGLRSKSSRAIGAGAIKDCKELLKDIFKLEVALSAKTHVLQVSDLSGLCFSEAYFEINGVAPRSLHSEPFRIAQAALDYPPGCCVDAALASLSIYEDASTSILHRFKVQNLYYEIREEALSALDRVICSIVNRSFADFRSFVGENILKFDEGQSAVHTLSGLHRKYEAVFDMSLIRIAGCKVDVGSALVVKVKELFQSNAEAIMDRLADPTSFRAIEQSLQLLRHTHSILSHYISVPPWSQVWKDKVDSPMPKPFSESVVGIFGEFKYFTFLNEFRRHEVKSCLVKTTSLGPTLNISATCFGVPHILSIRKLIGYRRMEDLIAHILEWISAQVEKEALPRIEGLMQAGGINTSGNFGSLINESTKVVIQGLDSFQRARAHWQVVMDRLEAVGNGLAFLHLLDGLDDVWHSCASNELEEDLPDGDKPSHSTASSAVSNASQSPTKLLIQGLQTIEGVLLKWGYGLDHRNEVHHQLSALFIWAAYVSENESYGGKVIGDGFLWALHSIAGILGQDRMWKAFSWASTFDHATTLNVLLTGSRSPVEERTLQVRIRQWSGVWDHVSFIFPSFETWVLNRNAAATCEPDPPLVGFFGNIQSLGISKLPQVPMRQSADMESSRGPFSHRPQHENASNLRLSRNHVTRAASAEPYGRTSVAHHGQFSPRYSSKLANYGTLRHSPQTTKPKKQWKR